MRPAIQETAKMSDDLYPVVEALPSELHSAPHEPASRLEMSAALNDLKKSVQSDGLLYPPLVTRKPDGNGFMIVDGHRRVKACVALGWQRVPVIVCAGRPEQLFSVVNGMSVRIKAAQWVEVYLHGGDVPSGRTKTNIKKIDELKGREFLVRLSAAGLSPMIMDVAVRFTKYADVDESTLPNVLEWLLKHKITRQVAAWISGETPPGGLRDAFENDRAPSLS